MAKQQFPEPTVGALIVNKAGKIFLMRSPKWFDRYCLPGGHVELGETLEQALIREVKEETGLSVIKPKFLFFQEAIYDKSFWKPRHFLFFNYLCEAISSTVQLDGTEATNYRWVFPAEAMKLLLTSYTRNSVEYYIKKGEVKV